MTKFSFSLRRVLDFRRLRADVARNALDRLHAERQQLLAREHSVYQSRQDEEEAVREPGLSLTNTRLDALDQMQAYVAIARQRCAHEYTQLDERIRQQKAAVMEAEREVGLLEKLEARQRADWQVCFDKKLEELAADSYMSRLYRRSHAR